jgi:tetratricopeptide (TPR) repeat protein
MNSGGEGSMPDVHGPIKVFCLYAPEDKCLFQDLDAHLSSLKRQGLITLWHNHLILPGSDQEQATTTHLNTASLILLLISSAFINSDYCYSVKMKQALQRHEAKEARVIPILLRSVDYKGAPFEHLAVLPTDAKPITDCLNRDAAFADIAAGIRRAIGDLSFIAISTSRTALPAIWNIPYRRNPFFIGRDEILSDLHAQLQSGQATALSQSPHAISGLGGIGKTQIATEYAYRYHQEYDAVFWARAESKEVLSSSYDTIAELLHLPERNQKQEMIIQAVKTWLQTHGKWLLILDNVDDLAMVQSFVPPTQGGHMLLTTRALAMGGFALNMNVDEFDDEQGALFLLRRATIIGPKVSLEQASIENRQLSTRITHELGGLPLALDQAGAYLEETGMSLEQYVQVYQLRRTDLLKKRGGFVPDHPETVATTWSLSFRGVKEKSLAAAELLQFCAYLAPDAIDEEIIIQGASFLGPVLSPVAADLFLLNQAIEVLRAYSLVRRDSKASTLSIHRLVQAVLHDDIAPETATQWKQRAVSAISTSLPKIEQWNTWEARLPHALICVDWIKQEQMTSPSAVHLLKLTGLYLSTRARYAQAQSLLEQALIIDEQVGGPEQIAVAIDLNNLGSLYWEQGKYEEAESSLTRAMTIWKQQDQEHPGAAECFNNLACVYQTMGRYKEAEPLFWHALNIDEQVFGPEHSEVAIDLSNLAEIYRTLGRYEEAKSLLERALAIWKRLNQEHPNGAVCLHNLAHLYLEQGRYTQQEPFLEHSLLCLERALAIHEKHPLNLEHPDTTIYYHNQAAIYRTQGKNEEAEALFIHAIGIKERLFGPAHTSIAASLNELALLYLEQGKYTQAEPLLMRAVEIRQRHLDHEHPDTAACLHNLGLLYLGQGRYAEAKPLLEHALTIHKKLLDPKHPKTLLVQENYASLLWAMGQKDIE